MIGEDTCEGWPRWVLGDAEWCGIAVAFYERHPDDDSATYEWRGYCWQRDDAKEDGRPIPKPWDVDPFMMRDPLTWCEAVVEFETPVDWRAVAFAAEAERRDLAEQLLVAESNVFQLERKLAAAEAEDSRWPYRGRATKVQAARFYMFESRYDIGEVERAAEAAGLEVFEFRHDLVIVLPEDLPARTRDTEPAKTTRP